MLTSKSSSFSMVLSTHDPAGWDPFSLVVLPGALVTAGEQWSGALVTAGEQWGGALVTAAFTALREGERWGGAQLVEVGGRG